MNTQIAQTTEWLSDLRVLSEQELNEVNGGLIWHALAIIGGTIAGSAAAGSLYSWAVGQIVR